MGRPINEKQLEVLTWLAAGNETDPPDPTYKLSAVALANRGLATVQRPKGVWTARLTDKGRYVAEQGVYPEETTKAAQPAQARPTSGKQGARSTPRAVATVSPAEQLVRDVVAAGGVLEVEDAQQGYLQSVASATRHGKVPAGKRLVVDFRGWGKATIRLVDKPAWMTEGLLSVKGVDRLRKPHPVVAAVRDDRRALPFRREVRQRALRVLDSIAKDAVGRGWEVHPPEDAQGSYRSKVVLALEVQGHRFDLAVSEESDRSPHTPTASELRDKERYSWTRIPEYDYSPSGRLMITLDKYGPVLQSVFRDTKTIDLFDRLPLLMYEIELRAAREEDRRIKREREEAERRARWERVRAEAESQLVQHHRGTVFEGQVRAWRRHQDALDFLAVLRQHVERLDPGDREAAKEWLTWCEERTTELDPLRCPVAMPADPEITAEALKPFMGGLSPHGPDRRF